MTSAFRLSFSLDWRMPSGESCEYSVFPNAATVSQESNPISAFFCHSFALSWFECALSPVVQLSTHVFEYLVPDCLHSLGKRWSWRGWSLSGDTDSEGRGLILNFIAQVYVLLSLCFLTADIMWPAISCSCCDAFPTLMGCTLKLEYKIDSSYFAFVNMIWIIWFP